MNDPPGERPADALVGTVLAGRYRILRLLGEGAMGAVYLGEHLKFGRKDAIKVLKASMARDHEATKRFLRGAQNASAINHRNVCTVYDFSDTEEGLQFLAMEFVDGETLADLVEREGALPVGRAVEIVTQAAAALDAAHDRGIVHRDLKPGNIMLTRAREGGDLVKVVDFDIAKGSREGEGGEVTRLGFVVGTPEYMSPEQLTGDPLDGRSDLYSLALVLFRALTGKLPLRSASTQDLLVERLTEDPLTLAEVVPALAFPPGLQSVIDRALQRRKEDRWASARDLAQALRGALAGTSPPTPPVVRPEAVGPALVTGVPGPAPAAGVPATMVSEPGTRPPAPASSSSNGRGRLIGGAVAACAALIVVALVGIRALGSDGISPQDSTPAAARQLDLLAIGGASALRAAEDTATIIVGMMEAPIGARAIAGHVLGAVSAARGDTAAAVRHLESALALDPSLAGARELLDRLRRLGLDPTQAALVLTRQLERLTDPTLADLRAAADTATLITQMEAVPSSTRALAHHVLGRVSAERGDTAGAITWLEGALELDADREDSAALLTALRTAGPTDPDPAPPVRPFGPEEAEDLAFRQLDRMVDPSPAQLRAAEDTATMVVEMEAAPASVRAVAAYVLAEISVARRDTTEAIRWLDQALAFDPGQQGPRTLLERLRGG